MEEGKRTRAAGEFDSTALWSFCRRCEDLMTETETSWASNITLLLGYAKAMVAERMNLGFPLSFYE